MDSDLFRGTPDCFVISWFLCSYFKHCRICQLTLTIDNNNNEVFNIYHWSVSRTIVRPERAATVTTKIITLKVKGTMDKLLKFCITTDYQVVRSLFKIAQLRMLESVAMNT